jgi:peptidoglycan hydrolase-like protein with peptidoglycan-binding domain
MVSSAEVAVSPTSVGGKASETPVAAAPAKPNVPTIADSAPLTVDEVREAQNWLKAFGLDPGDADGLTGPLTSAAIKKFEAARLRPVTGVLDRQLLERLRHDTGGPIR